MKGRLHLTNLDPGHLRMKNFPINNLFNNVPVSFTDEFVDILSENKNVRIERIVSKGHASPENFWYDQDRDEFVILLKGSARLAFKDEQEVVELKPGDYLHIRAHVKHRVEWTSTKEDTFWLAVHY